jgi:hypothetical protein
MIENYQSADYNKFEFMADTFFRAGFGSVQFRGSQSNMLLSNLMTEFDEAFIVSILHNGFNRWAQEATIMASGGKVDSKRLEKAKWTDTGLAAKKYEGWVEEGIEFFNDQVMELQILRRTATSKSMEEKYLQKKREKMEEKSKGPVKRSNQVSALNGLVAVQEDVVRVEQQSSIPGMVTYPIGSNKRNKSQLGGGRRISNESEHSSSLSASYQSGGGGDNADDESSEDPSNNYYPPRNHAPV